MSGLRRLAFRVHHQAAPWHLVLGLVATAVALRLWHLGAAPLDQDGAQFLSAAREQLRTGSWATSSPAVGTEGLRYGPTVVWWYGAVQWVLGESPLVAMGVMVVLTTATQVVLVQRVTRIARLGPAGFLVLGALVVSSPYLHAWARLAWDQSVLVLVAVVVAILATERPLTAWHGVSVGAALGLALGSHPMALPFAVATVAVLTWELRATAGRLIRIVGPLVATAVIVLLPYLGEVMRHPVQPEAASADPELVLANVAHAGAVTTAYGVEYFFDATWTSFRSWLGPWTPLLGLRSFTLLVVLVATVLGLASGVRGDGPRRRLALLGASTWAAAAVLFALRGLEPHPHYHFGTWWVVPVGLALAAQRAPSPVRAAAVAGAAMVVAVHVVLVAGWMTYVADGHGTRDRLQGPGIHEQQRVVHTICTKVDGPTTVQNDTNSALEPLQYLVRLDDACGRHAVTFCNPADCRPLTKGRAPDLVITYREATGSRLLVTEP